MGQGSGEAASARISGAGRRREVRIPVRLFGTLACPGRPPACIELSDLSRGGACCTIASPPAVGVEVDLRLDSLAVRALVCWVSGCRIGLGFTQPLRASDILIQSGRSRSGQGREHPLHAQRGSRALHRSG
jgi:hypothetical protein